MSRQTLLTTANQVIEGFNTWTPTSVMSFRAPNCIHEVLPLSLGRPAMNNEKYLAFFQPLMPAFRNFTLKAHDIIVDEAERKVVVHASSTAMTVLGEYGNEYILVLHMDEPGEKVEKLLEYVDSAYSQEFMTKLRKRLVSQEKEGNL